MNFQKLLQVLQSDKAKIGHMVSRNITRVSNLYFQNSISCIGTFTMASYTIHHQKTKIQFLDIDNFVLEEVPFYIQPSTFQIAYPRCWFVLIFRKQILP